jgi:phosphopantetheine adenylyltransferase
MITCSPFVLSKSGAVPNFFSRSWLVIPGYIWRTVQREGARVLYRGIRTWDMDGPDERKLQILNTWGPLVLGPLWWPLPTVFLQGDPQYAHISSTLIREVCSSNPSINIRAQLQVESKLQSLVPSCIVQDVMQLYGDDNSKRND